MASLDELLEQAEEKIEKGEELDLIESDHHGKDKSKVESQKSKIQEQIKQARMEKNEAEAVNQESEGEEATESELEEVKTEEKKAKKKTKKGKAKVRSKRYQEAKALIDANKKYDISEALELAKKTSLTKFDGNVEIHARLLGKSGKPEQVRGMITYPHSTGKSVKVVILDDAIIEEIAKTQKIDADIYLTTPANMSKVAKLAKILGPKGKMPSPKSGTITTDPEKTKQELSGGKTEYKTDSYGIVHQVIGKISAKPEELVANYKTLISVLPVEKINSITLCATMGPGIRVSK